MADTVEAVVAVLEAVLRAEREDLLDASVYAILARLRRFNRDAHARVNEQRQSTMDARNAIDQTHLGLQNLLYERRHLEREIQKCREFQYVRPIALARLCTSHTFFPRSCDLINSQIHLPRYSLVWLR
jgi:hypothetical protein